MNKITFALLGLCLAVSAFGQNTNEKLVELAKTYRNFMFRNEPTKEMLKEVQTGIPEGLQTATDFIVQTITTKNKLLTASFLALPDEKTVKQIYIVSVIDLNLQDENQIDNNTLIDSLMRNESPRYEMVDNYYDMLFTAVGNKNQPFDFSKADLKLKDYNLKDDTEKSILFLQCMAHCGSAIWGYMNIVKPPNTKKAYEYIGKFPSFNGLPYYQYNDLFFPDFEMVIDREKGKQSYKGYYLDKYYETLLSHLICINEQGGSEKEKTDLLLGSILKESKLYKYTKYKETLESIFKKQKEID